MSFLQKIRLSSRLKYCVKELPALTASFQWCKSESGIRKYSTSKNIIRSACPDVDIPVTTVSNFIWDSSTKLWPDRIALVKFLSLLLLLLLPQFVVVIIAVLSVFVVVAVAVVEVVTVVANILVCCCCCCCFLSMLWLLLLYRKLNLNYLNSTLLLITI